MCKNFYLLMTGLIFLAGPVFAQEILPDFTIYNLKGKITVNWLNNYPTEIKGISIQRSYDSIRNFSTLASVLNPKNIKNGFVDKNPPYNKMFYRLFIVFDSGGYTFSRSKKPDSDPKPVITEVAKDSVKHDETAKKIKPEILVEKKAPVREPKNEKRDNQPVEKIIKKEIPVVPKEEIFIPSKRIFTGKDNNIVIILPEVKSNKYVIKFFDDEDKPLFELNNITEDYLIIEKMNFLHSGWFRFEIYENDKLLEKHKFYIPKDGKNQ